MLSVLAIAQGATTPAAVPIENVNQRITASSYVKGLAGSNPITIVVATQAETKAADGMFKDFPTKADQSDALPNPDYVAQYTPSSGDQQGQQQKIPVRVIQAKAVAPGHEAREPAEDFALQFSKTNIEQPPAAPLSDAQKARDVAAINADSKGDLKKIIDNNPITQIVYMSDLDALRSSDDGLLAARSYIVTTAANVVQACVYNTPGAQASADNVLNVEVKDLIAGQTTYKIPFFLMIVVAVVLAVVVGVMCCRGSSDSTQNSAV